MATTKKPNPETLAAYRALGYNSPPRSSGTIRGRSQTLEQVVEKSPDLAKLSAMTQDGQNRLKAIAPLLPNSLRPLIQSGGIEDETWCLLVPNSAIASKLRQILPALCAHLRSKGWNINQIRIKVSSTR